MIGNWNYGTGRRKSSVARVFLKRGTGEITVNGKHFGALAREQHGGRLAVAPAWSDRARAGDDRNFVLQPRHVLRYTAAHR